MKNQPCWRGVISNRDGSSGLRQGRRLFQVIHGGLFARLPIEAHEEVRKKLDKDDPTDPGAPSRPRSAVQQETQEIADKLGVEAPDWFDDGDPWDAPSDFKVGGEST